MCRTYTVCRCIHYIPNNLRLSKMQTVQNYWQTIPAIQFVGNRNKGGMLTPTRERACPMRSRGTTAAEPGSKSKWQREGAQLRPQRDGGHVKLPMGSNKTWPCAEQLIIALTEAVIQVSAWQTILFPHFVFFDDEFSKTNSYRAKYGVPQSYQNKSVLQRIQFDTVAP